MQPSHGDLPPRDESTHWAAKELHPVQSPSSSAAPLFDASYENPAFREHFRRYNAKDLMKAKGLAQHKDLFEVCRKYISGNIRSDDILWLLNAVQNDPSSLEFFETLRAPRHDDLLDYQDRVEKDEDTMRIHERHMPGIHNGFQYEFGRNALRDSGYESRPPSEVRSSIGSGFRVETTIQPQPSVSSPQLTRPSQPLSSDKTASNLSPFRPYLNVNSPQNSNGAATPQVPYDPPAGSPAPTPLETTKSRNLCELECMYCGKEYVRAGDCLNHEENHHGQKKQWMCVHCELGKATFSTKQGYDRHHKTHPCLHCPENVTWTGPSKKACVCQYCSKLFEGEGCFQSRAKHVETQHYKGEYRMTRANLSFSNMIEVLLQRQSLSEPWMDFLQSKPERKLTWTANAARSLLDDLEYESYPQQAPNLLERIYDLAEKSLPSAGDATLSTNNSRISGAEGLESPVDPGLSNHVIQGNKCTLKLPNNDPSGLSRPPSPHPTFRNGFSPIMEEDVHMSSRRGTPDPTTDQQIPTSGFLPGFQNEINVHLSQRPIANRNFSPLFNSIGDFNTGDNYMSPRQVPMLEQSSTWEYDFQSPTDGMYSNNDQNLIDMFPEPPTHGFNPA